MLDADSAYAGRGGFLEPPFLEGADARFLYRSAALTQAIDAVLDRIARGDHVIAVLGVPGIGKTTVCAELARELAAHAAVEGEDVAIVDDADALDVERLRDCLRAHTGECGSRVVLVGRPELAELLEQAECGEHPVARIRLGPLEEHEILEYIDRRMWVARGGTEKFRDAISDAAAERGHFSREPRFSRRAVRRLAVATGGNPRAVNILCAQAIARAARRQPVRRSVLRLAWCALGAGLVALAMMPSLSSKRSAAVDAEPDRMRAPLVRGAESFDAFRGRTLRRAAELAAVPDVRELLRVRADVLSEARRSSDPQQAFTDLVTEIDRITNQARARQLELDHRQMLEYSKQH